jgi:hypothetical protein
MALGGPAAALVRQVQQQSPPWTFLPPTSGLAPTGRWTGERAEPEVRAPTEGDWIGLESLPPPERYDHRLRGGSTSPRVQAPVRQNSR